MGKADRPISSAPMEEVVLSRVPGQATSAAAFVEGGIQDACDDACSICLENFSQSDPSVVTKCSHEFHLQCVLEWCQRSSNCPMCWQQISMKDPASQELLDAVEQERNFRSNAVRKCRILRHPILGDIELPHLPPGISRAEAEERILQHLAVAMAGHNRIYVREGQNRPSLMGQQGFAYISAPRTSPTTPVSSLPSTSSPVARSEPTRLPVESISIAHHDSAYIHGYTIKQSSNHHPNPSGESLIGGQERARPSESQILSESMRSRFNSLSMRYRDSILKSTRSWKEKLFIHSNSMVDIGSEARRNVDVSSSNSHI